MVHSGFEKHDTELLSVIVPVGSDHSYIKTCLKLIESQDYPSLEIIVIDNTVEQNIKEKYSRDFGSAFLWESLSSRGVSQARNYGISKCKGKYIAFVDSDDYLCEGHFKRAVETILASQGEIYFSSYVNVEHRSSMIRKATSNISLFKLLTYNPIGTSSVVLLADLKPKFQNIMERNDLLLWYQLYSAGHKFVSRLEVGYQRNLHKLGISYNKIRLIGIQYSIYRNYLKLNFVQAIFYLIILCLRHSFMLLVRQIKKVSFRDQMF